MQETFNIQKKLRRAFLVWLCVVVLTAFGAVSCRRAENDLRRLAPADALVYMETKNLGKTLETLSHSKNFQKAAAREPDFFALEGVALAVVVTGFRSSEKLSGDAAILQFQPRFVAIAETNAWSWQATRLIENNLDKFVKKHFGATANYEKMSNDGGEFYVWSGTDGRKLFAYGKSSLIYFGNDEAAIKKCLAASGGAAENLAANDALNSLRESSKDALAYGYVAPAGVGEFADYVGVSTAVEASDETNPRAVISSVVPPVLKKTIREIFWSAREKDGKIEDLWQIKTDAESSKIWRETLGAGAAGESDAAEFLPSDIFSATRYNLQNPQIAWRGLVLTAARQLNETQAKFLIAFSNSFFAPYNVADGEAFLNATGDEIWTARFDAAGDENVVIAVIKDRAAIEKTLAPEINFEQKPLAQNAARIFVSEDKTQAAAFVADKIILGDLENVTRCLAAKEKGNNLVATEYFSEFKKTNAAAATFSKDTESANKIVGVLTELKADAPPVFGANFVTTQFLTDRFERRAVSDFGLIGTLIEQFDEQ